MLSSFKDFITETNMKLSSTWSSVNLIDGCNERVHIGRWFETMCTIIPHLSATAQFLQTERPSPPERWHSWKGSQIVVHSICYVDNQQRHESGTDQRHPRQPCVLKIGQAEGRENKCQYVQSKIVHGTQCICKLSVYNIKYVYSQFTNDY